MCEWRVRMFVVRMSCWLGERWELVGDLGPIVRDRVRYMYRMGFELVL